MQENHPAIFVKPRKWFEEIITAAAGIAAALEGLPKQKTKTSFWKGIDFKN